MSLRHCKHWGPVLVLAFLEKDSGLTLSGTCSISARLPSQFPCRLQEDQEPNQLIQTQASTPVWFWSLHSVHQPWLPRSRGAGEPTAKNRRQTAQRRLFQGQASEARTGPAPPSCCLSPLLRLPDSHPLSIQGCRGNCRLGQAPGAPSPPAAASPPVTLLSPP